MNLPQVGDIITVPWGIELCRYFGLEGDAERVQAHPERYRAFKYDGCSGLPDRLFQVIDFAGLDWDTITNRCCLPHDLGYAYGIPGDEGMRALTDMAFYQDLIFKADVPKDIAGVFLWAVRKFGKSGYGSDFSWAFTDRGVGHVANG